MTDPASLAIIAVAFVAGGFLKGFAGLGLPLVTVTVLNFVFGLPAAVALMTVSGLATNAYQAFGGPHLREGFLRIWPFIAACCLFVWFGTGILVSVDQRLLVIALGLLLAVSAALAILGWSPSLSRPTQRWLGPLVGALNGLCCGITGITSVPSVIYVRALGMPREMMIQAMGALFGLSYIAIVAALVVRGTYEMEVGLVSALAVPPAFAGMWLGRRLRLRTDPARFTTLFNWTLLAIGSAIVVRAI